MKHLKFIILAVILVCSYLYNEASAQGRYDEYRYKYERSWKFDDYKVTTKGKVDFNYDYTDVAMMGEEAYLKIAKVSKGITRKLHFGTKDGNILYRYFENNKEVSFDSKGRDWMNEILPVVIRNTGMDLKTRIKRLYKDGGLAAFIKELDLISDENSKFQMLNELLTNHKLNNSELLQLVSYFPSNDKEGYMIEQLLQTHADKYLRTEELSKAYFTCLKNISSSERLSMTMQFVYDNNELSEANYDRFISIISGIKNESKKHHHYNIKSSLLRTLISDEKVTNKRLAKILNQVKSLNSDREKSDFLISALKINKVSNVNIVTILSIVKSINGYSKSSVLQASLEKGLVNISNYSHFKQAASTISEDNNMSMILYDLLRYEKLGDDNFDKALALSDYLSSAQEKISFYQQLFQQGQLSDSKQLQILGKMADVDNQRTLSLFLNQSAYSLNLENKEIKVKLIELAGKINDKHQSSRLIKSFNSERRW